jgi:hypothetical protein
MLQSTVSVLKRINVIVELLDAYFHGYYAWLQLRADFYINAYEDMTKEVDTGMGEYIT